MACFQRQSCSRNRRPTPSVLDERYEFLKPFYLEKIERKNPTSLKAVAECALISEEIRKLGPIKVVREKGEVWYSKQGGISVDVVWYVIMPEKYPDCFPLNFPFLPRTLSVDLNDFIFTSMAAIIKNILKKQLKWLIPADSAKFRSSYLKSSIKNNNAKVFVFETKYQFCQYSKFMYRIPLYVKVLDTQESKYKMKSRRNICDNFWKFGTQCPREDVRNLSLKLIKKF